MFKILLLNFTPEQIDEQNNMKNNRTIPLTFVDVVSRQLHTNQHFFPPK